MAGHRPHAAVSGRASPVAALAASMAMSFSPLPFAGFALVGAVPAIVIGLLLLRRTRDEATTV